MVPTCDRVSRLGRQIKEPPCIRTAPIIGLLSVANGSWETSFR